MVSLKPDHPPTEGYVKMLRLGLARAFPGVTFYSLPADMITQILNFRLPAPIHIQITGADIQANRTVANRISRAGPFVPGAVDARIQQDFDYPMFQVNVDRTKAQSGLSERLVRSTFIRQ